MNKKTVFFCWFFLSCVMPGIVSGGQMRLIHVEISYSGSAVSYNLYKDGVQVCVSNDPGATQMDCNVEINAAPMTFVLTAVDAAGVESPQSAPYVLIPPTLDPATNNFIPQASFTSTTTSGMAPLPVSFDASSSSDLDGLIIAYAWDFGDGSTGAGKLIDYTFAAAGTYTVTLTIVDDRGASAVNTTTVTVGDQPPAANTPPVAVLNATPMLVGTSQIGFDAYKSSDVDGTITSYAWNFGDGDTAVGNYVEHEFKAAGDYTVVLTVTDDKGASSTDQMIITVVDTPKPANLPPVAVISASSEKRLLHFAWDYTGADSGLAGFRLYQNSRMVCQVADPLARETDCLTYVDNGAVELWVTSYDQAGMESAASAALRFDSTDTLPVATGGAPLVVHFTSGASSDPDGTISTYAWNFGDGATGEGMAADHVFTVPGEYTVTLTLTDNSGVQAQATVVITVSDVNPPTASNASFFTLQDKSVTGTLSANDPDGSPLTYKISKDASLGTATITNSATGVFTYVPRAGSAGADSFSFKANDGTFDSNEAVVSIMIEKVNLAPVAKDQTFAVQEDTPVAGVLTATDANSDPVTFAMLSPPVHGQAVLVDAGTGAFQYTPEVNYHGADSFTFKVNDGLLDSVAANVQVTIDPVNDVPTANPDSAQVESGKQVIITALDNDTDVDGDALSIVELTAPAHGQAVIANGALSYTANNDFNGQDSFSYTISDGAGGVASAEVSITVLPPPVGATPKESITYTWEYDATVPGLSGFKLYLNGEFLCETADPAARSLTCLAPVSSGVKAFSLQAIIDNAMTTSPSNTITFDPNAPAPPPVPVNEAPATTHQTLTLAEDAALEGTLSATDTNNDPLTFSLVAPPKHGVANVSASGSFTYTPAANFNGSDSFTFKANDGQVDSAEGVVALTVSPVNDAPVAPDGTLTTEEDIPGAGQLTASDLDGDSLTYTIVRNGSKGEVVISDAASGMFTYAPKSNENGQDSFVYRVSDGVLTADATVTVTITLVNDAPVAIDGALATEEETSASGQLTATDPEGDSLTYSMVTNGAKGTAKITNASTGTFTYVPAQNENGQDSFVYRVSDGKLSSEAKVVVNITAVNDAPFAENDMQVTPEDTLVSGRFLGSDLDGDRLSYSIITNGNKGKAAIVESAIGLFTYTPSANENGADTIVYQVSDGVLTAQASVSVTIAPVNDAPTLSPDVSQVESGKQVSIAVLGNDSDIEKDTLVITSVTAPSHGQTSIVNGEVSYTADVDFEGTDSFSYTVTDGNGGSATETVTVTVVAPAVVTPTESLTYTWDYDTTAPGLAGFKLYMNGELLCETSNPSARTLTCQAPVTDGVKVFYLKAIGANAIETDASNSITFDPKLTVTSPVQANTAPLATNQTLALAEDVPASGTLSATDSNNDSLTFSLVTPPAHGIATVAASGAFTYTPTANFHGTDTFTFKANDGLVDSAEATVTLVVTPVNDAPKAVSISVWATEDVVASGQLQGSDVDGDRLSCSIVTNGSKGSVAIADSASGAFTYTPSKDVYGEDTFTFRVSDGAVSADATVTVTIEPINDAPVANPDVVQVIRNSKVIISVLANDGDVDSDLLTVASVSVPVHGTAVIGATSAITYTPTRGYRGTDSFRYTVSDGKGGAATGSVSVTVQ